MPYSKCILEDIMRIIQGHTSIYLTCNNPLNDFSNKWKLIYLEFAYNIRIRKDILMISISIACLKSFGQSPSDREVEII